MTADSRDILRVSARFKQIFLCALIFAHDNLGDEIATKVSCWFTEDRENLLCPEVEAKFFVLRSHKLWLNVM